jgi:hypothetical protein
MVGLIAAGEREWRAKVAHGTFATRRMHAGPEAWMATKTPVLGR